MTYVTTLPLRSLGLALFLTMFMPLAAVAQSTLVCTKLHPCNSVEMGFDPAISGVQTDRQGLEDVLRQYTQLEVNVSNQASPQVVFVYGIGQGENIVSGPIISNEVIMVPGDPALIAKGAGPIASPWDAYADPLLGYADPLLGYADPLLGFEDPLGYADPLLGYADPLLGLNAIWGTGNVGLEPDDYGLVLFSMSVGEGGAPVLHDAAIVPFSVTEGTAAKQGGNTVPEAFTLEAAYPNPFNPQTTLRYTLPKAAQVRMAVYDVLGREVALLVDSEQAAGTHTALFEASRLSSGVYLVRLEAGVFAQTQRVTLVK